MTRCCEENDKPIKEVDCYQNPTEWDDDAVEEEEGGNSVAYSEFTVSCVDAVKDRLLEEVVGANAGAGNILYKINDWHALETYWRIDEIMFISDTQRKKNVKGPLSFAYMTGFYSGITVQENEKLKNSIDLLNRQMSKSESNLWDNFKAPSCKRTKKHVLEYLGNYEEEIFGEMEVVKRVYRCRAKRESKQDKYTRSNRKMQLELMDLQVFKEHLERFGDRCERHSTDTEKWFANLGEIHGDRLFNSDYRSNLLALVHRMPDFNVLDGFKKKEPSSHAMLEHIKSLFHVLTSIAANQRAMVDRKDLFPKACEELEDVWWKKREGGYEGLANKKISMEEKKRKFRAWFAKGVQYMRTVYGEARDVFKQVTGKVPGKRKGFILSQKPGMCSSVKASTCAVKLDVIQVEAKDGVGSARDHQGTVMNPGKELFLVAPSCREESGYFCSHSCGVESRKSILRISKQLKEKIMGYLFLGFEPIEVEKKLITDGHGEHDRAKASLNYITAMKKSLGLCYDKVRDIDDIRYLFEQDVGKTKGIGPEAWGRAIKMNGFVHTDEVNFGLPGVRTSSSRILGVRDNPNPLPISELEKDTFLMIEMSDGMVQSCREARLLYMDETHNVCAGVNFKIATLMARSKDHDKGVHLAYIYSNKWDTETYHCAFAIIKRVVEDEHNGATKGYRWLPEALMTDCTIAGPKGLENALGYPLRRALCIWHVVKAFSTTIRSKILHQKKNKARNNLISAIVSMFRDCIYATTPDELKANFSKLVNKLIHWEQTEIKAYLDNEWTLIFPFEQWSLAFRKHESFRNCLGFPERTNMLCEAWHRNLKWHVLEKKQSKRLGVFMRKLKLYRKKSEIEEFRLRKGYRTMPPRLRKMEEDASFLMHLSDFQSEQGNLDPKLDWELEGMKMMEQMRPETAEILRLFESKDFGSGSEQQQASEEVCSMLVDQQEAGADVRSGSEQHEARSDVEKVYTNVHLPGEEGIEFMMSTLSNPYLISQVEAHQRHCNLYGVKFGLQQDMVVKDGCHILRKCTDEGRASMENIKAILFDKSLRRDRRKHERVCDLLGVYFTHGTIIRQVSPYILIRDLDTWDKFTTADGDEPISMDNIFKIIYDEYVTKDTERRENLAALLGVKLGTFAASRKYWATCEWVQHIEDNQEATCIWRRRVRGSCLQEYDRLVGADRGKQKGAKRARQPRFGETKISSRQSKKQKKQKRDLPELPSLQSAEEVKRKRNQQKNDTALKTGNLGGRAISGRRDDLVRLKDSVIHAFDEAARIKRKNTFDNFLQKLSHNSVMMFSLVDEDFQFPGVPSLARARLSKLSFKIDDGILSRIVSKDTRDTPQNVWSESNVNSVARLLNIEGRGGFRRNFDRCCVPPEALSLMSCDDWKSKILAELIRGSNMPYWVLIGEAQALAIPLSIHENGEIHWFLVTIYPEFDSDKQLIDMRVVINENHGSITSAHSEKIKLALQFVFIYRKWYQLLLGNVENVKKIFSRGQVEEWLSQALESFERVPITHFVSHLPRNMWDSGVCVSALMEAFMKQEENDSSQVNAECSNEKCRDFFDRIVEKADLAEIEIVEVSDR